MSGPGSDRSIGRISAFDPAGADPSLRKALEELPDLAFFSALAHAESLFKPFLRFGAAILGSLSLPADLREIAILQVAHSAESSYEWAQHVSIALEAGVAAESIEAIRLDESSADDGPEQVVRQVAAAVVTGEQLDDQDFARLRSHLDEREVVELLMTAGDYLMLARLMSILELPPDQPVGESIMDSMRKSS